MKWAVYESIDGDNRDDRGLPANLQYQSGGYGTKEEASREASRLNKLYQGFYSFVVKDEVKVK